MLVYQSQILLRGSAPGGLLKHLSECLLQPLDIRQRAESDPSRKQVRGRQGNSPSSHSQLSMRYRNLSLPDLSRSPSGPSLAISQFGPPEALQNSRIGPLGRFHPYSGFTGSSSSSPLEFASDSGSLTVPFQVPNFSSRSSSPALNQPLFERTGSTLSRVSSTDSIAPSDSASAISRTSGHSGDRRRLGSSGRKVPGSDKLAIVPWNDSTRQRFEQYIVRLTASAGFSLSWVENNVWHSFLEEFLPSAPKISRKVLTSRILPEVVKEVQEKVKKYVAGKEVTMQGDGWTGTNNQHLLAFMITCDKKVNYSNIIIYLINFSNTVLKVYSVRVHDATGERKTAENLLVEIEHVLALLTEEWGTIVVALVTDASGEARKARRLFAAKHPSIIVLDCYSHQVRSALSILDRGYFSMLINICCRLI